MTGRSLFTVAAANALRAQDDAAAQDGIANGTWHIVGTVPPQDRGPERRIALSPDGQQYALLTEILGVWSIHSGPWSYATMERCAELIASGDKRAITWNDAQLCLAVGYLALICEGERRRKQKASPAQAGDECVPLAGSDGSSPLPSSPPADALPPADPRCNIAGCGE